MIAIGQILERNGFARKSKGVYTKASTCIKLSDEYDEQGNLMVALEIDGHPCTKKVKTLRQFWNAFENFVVDTLRRAWNAFKPNTKYVKYWNAFKRALLDAALKRAANKTVVA